MTVQKMYTKPPSVSEDTLVFTLMCPSCEAYRSFRFAETIKTITSRKHSGMDIEASCNKCRHEMRVSLFWASDRPGFSSRNPVDSYDGKVVSVTDPMPLMKENSE